MAVRAARPARVWSGSRCSGLREPAAEVPHSDPVGAMGPLSPVITPDGRFYAFVYARRLSDLYVVDGLR